MRRRATSDIERLHDCQCCGEPLAQRHHPLDFAEYGESGGVFYYFCGSCHDLYHIAWQALVEKGKRSVRVWQGYLSKTNGGGTRARYMVERVQEAFALKLQFDLERTDKSRTDSAFSARQDH